MTTHKPKLLPCPWCGGAGWPSVHHKIGYVLYSIACSAEVCDATGPKATSEREAFKRWNSLPRARRKVKQR